MPNTTEPAPNPAPQPSKSGACPVCQGTHLIIKGAGNPQSKIVFVTDNTGPYEEGVGKPLQGMNGKLFDRLLLRAGLSRKDVFITSAIRCKNVSKKPKDLQRAIESYFEQLNQEIVEVNPNIIVPMGTTALRAVLQSKTLNITKERGIVRQVEKYGRKVLPIFHPAYLMQVPNYEQITVQDLLRIKNESRSKEQLTVADKKLTTITTLDEFYKFVAEYKNVSELACDIESTGLSWFTDKIIGISFSKAENEGVYIPLIKGNGDLSSCWETDHPRIFSGLREVLEGPSRKIFHNGTFDIKMLKGILGIEVANFCQDTLLMDHLLDENARGLHGLESCALRFTDFGSYKQPVVQWFKDHKIAEKNRDFSLLPPELLHKYGAADAAVTFVLFKLFWAKLQEEGLTRLYTQVIMPAQRRLIETEYRGVEIDKDYLDKLGVQYKARLLDLEQQIYKLVGTFKITSSQELEKVLFTQLGLTPIEKTKSGRWSTDKTTLKELEDKHPVIKPIREFKLLTKLLRTYVVGMGKLLDSQNRLHTSYLLTGTTTGRMSSRRPNLQNIPAATNDIQTAFIAGKDRVFIAADYAQAEFKVWAHFSKDPRMMADCCKGKDFDIHNEVASITFKKPIHQITKQERNLAKTTVFGGIYGRGVKSISEQFKVPLQEASSILEYIKHRYPLGFRWIANQKHEATKTGEVYTLFGRKRRLKPMLESFNEEAKAQALRLAVNSPVQGSIGDLNNIAMLRVLKRFEQEKVDGYLALTIHDALTFNVLASQQELAARIIKEEMEAPAGDMAVPMRVDMKMGPTWGSVRKMEDAEDHELKTQLANEEQEVEQDDEEEIE